MGVARDRRARIGRLAVFAAAAASAALAAPASATTITPNTLNDDDADNGNCTLREAIIAANTDATDDACTAGTGADQIPLQAGTYELSVPGTGEEDAALGDLDITDPDGLKITGDPAGSTVDANAIDRIFNTRAAAIATFDSLTITGGNVTNDMGGAIDVAEGSTANIIDTTLTRNTATGEGGAIEVHGPAPAASTLNLIGSTVTGNASTDPSVGDGGGMEYDNNSTANVTNTTFSGNTAAGEGGAIETEGGIGNFLNVTITNNSAPSAGGIVLTQADGTVNLKGTILAGNTTTGTGPECNTVTATPVTSQGHNLIGNTSGCTITSQPTDIIGQSPQLGVLADNGGPTQTHALLSGSPAINAGPPDAPPADQRGAPRNPDIGAYERVLCGAVVVNRVGSSANDSLTGTTGRDGFLLLAGNDVASGLKGADALCGGDNKDKLKGGPGKDLLRGERGKDKLKGGGDKDKLVGGPGPDKLLGGKGRDKCVGGKGDDSAKSCEKGKV